MPNIQISQLPAAQTLDGTELVPIVQQGITVRTTTQAISVSPSQTQTFLTLNQEPTLPNSRALAGNNGVTLVDGGAQSTLTVELTGTALSLQNSADGLLYKVSGLIVPRTLVSGTAGVSIADGDGVAGNPTVNLSGKVLSLANIGSSNGLIANSGAGLTSVVLQGTTNQIDVANGSGPSNPTFSLADNPVIPGNGGMTIPIGTAAQQPAGTPGQIRYNSTNGYFEGYTTQWQPFSLAGGLLSFSAGATGFSPSVPSYGNIVLSGILNPASGGTGVNNGTNTISLGGNLSTAGAFSTSGAFSLNLTATGATNVTLPTTGTLATLAGAETLTNKTISGANNTLSNIGNSSLTNSSVTYNGVTVALGGSGTIYASNPNALTIGTGLSGGSYDGSAPVTIDIDSTVATLTGSQILTNKTISGSSNTLSNIGNSSLTNSSIIINGTTVSLGGSATISSTTTNSLTFNNGGSGAASGTAFDGSTAYTISYNTVGASPLAGSTSLTTLGTVTTGTWNASPIANSYLANSSLTLGTTSVALGATSLTLAGLTSVTLTQDPTQALQAATKQYVDAAVSNTNYHAACQWATTATLGTVTYSNGSSGVGATITNAGTQAALVIDGHTFTATDVTNGVRVLVKNMTNGAYNGIYTVTNQGSVSTNWVLTRATDYDQVGTGQNEIAPGDTTFIINGTVNAGTQWVQTTDFPITIGTTAIDFVQIAGPGAYTAGTGLTLTGTQFSITNTAVSAGSYGSGSSVVTFTVNAQGQLTLASNTSIAINGNQITSGTVGSSYISGSYTGITGVGTLTAGTWNASTIGVGYGGTGLASYTSGDLLYASGSTTLSKLGIGTSGQVLTSSGTAPQYVAQSTLSVGSATNATNATNVGTTATSTNTDFYIPFVASSSSGNQALGVDAGLSYNPSTNALTGGISGGTF
jgi:hypothetical protein